MASEKKISKGFGFYLIMILLLLLGAFVAIVCVMVIMPKTKILGLQYFTNPVSENILGIETDQLDDKGNPVVNPFNFSSLRSIVVTCGLSQVSVKYGEKNSIQFTNNAAGFAKASEDVDYTYNYKYENGQLKINVVEPEGFLMLSRDAKIEIVLNNAPSNIDVEVTTKAGSVILGTQREEKEENLKFDDLTVTTDSGNITLNNDVSLRTLDVTTSSGNFNCENEALDVRTCNLTTQTGSFTFNTVGRDGTTTDAKLNSGRLNFQVIHGSLKVSGSAFSVSGYEISENLSSDSKLDKANIFVGYVGKDVSLPSAGDSNIDLRVVLGQIYISSANGNIKIGGECDYKDKKGETLVYFPRKQWGIRNQSYISSQSGKIDVIVNDNIAATHYFASTSGEIDVAYFDQPYSKTYITSETGRVAVSTYDKFTLTFIFKDRAGKLYTKPGGNLSVALTEENGFKNPLILQGSNGDDNVIDISTDGAISCGLLAYSE